MDNDLITLWTSTVTTYHGVLIVLLAALILKAIEAYVDSLRRKRQISVVRTILQTEETLIQTILILGSFSFSLASKVKSSLEHALRSIKNTLDHDGDKILSPEQVELRNLVSEIEESLSDATDEVLLKWEFYQANVFEKLAQFEWLKFRS